MCGRTLTLFNHGEALEELNDVGPQKWTKALTCLTGPNGKICPEFFAHIKKGGTAMS